MGKRDDILTATLDLVVDEGLASFSFSKLFERAGVGAGTVYNYFESKDVLLETLYAVVSQRLDAAVLAGESVTASLEARLKTLLRNFARHALAHPKDIAFIEVCGRGNVLRRSLRERATAAQKVTLERIVEAQRAGLVRPMAPYLALTITSSVIVSVVAASGSGIYTLGEAELEIVLEAAWRSVAAERAPKQRTRRPRTAP